MSNRISAYVAKHSKIDKPLYKVGDIIVYNDRYCGESGMMPRLYQSNIVSAEAALDDTKENDSFEWIYNTAQTIDDAHDYLEEHEILYKL